MQPRSFGERLRLELESRQRKNSRYSLRAFAASLKTDHSTLSQIMRGTRHASVELIRSWSVCMKIDPEETALYIAAESIPDAGALRAQEQLRHWLAEAAALVNGPVHFQILRYSRTPEFQSDTRWLAEKIGVPVDEVNVALSRLLRLGFLSVENAAHWEDRTGLVELSETEFRKLALARVRRELGPNLPDPVS